MSGTHERQGSMEPEGGWSEYDVTETHHHDECGDGEIRQQDTATATNDILKPLVRRRLQHQRDLAHSLVGTPNYIAPEVLARTGMSLCLLLPRLSSVQRFLEWPK